MGSVNTAGAPGSIQIIEPDGGSGFNETTFLISAAANGTFSFDWSFDTSPDNCCSGVNVYNGGSTTLFNFSGPTSGSYSMAVAFGDTIGWGVYSTDTCCGANILTVSNFSTSVSAVPLPAAVWLFLSALGGLGLFGWRRRRPGAA